MEVIRADTDRLHVERYRADLVVSSTQGDAYATRAWLDDTMRRYLPDVLSKTLGGDGTDETVWLIRQLSVDFDINLTWDRRRIARHGAAAIARSLVYTLQDAGATGVVRFPNRDAYLAQFLTDLSEGQAWGRWYYRTFEGLRQLPLSAALRTAICEHPSIGRAALLRLDERDGDRVLNALVPPDARRVLDQMPTGAEHGIPGRCFEMLWAAWCERREPVPSEGQEFHTALRLYLHTCRHPTALRATGLKEMTRALVRLARLLRETPRTPDLLAALTASDPAALYTTIGSKDADTLRPLCRVPAGPLRVVGCALATPAPTAAHPVPTQRATPFGGLFLLLPLLDNLPAEELTQGWAEVEDTTAASMLRFVLLMKSLGQPRALQFFSDPLARDLLRISPTCTALDVGRWQAQLSRAQLDALLAALTPRPLGVTGEDPASEGPASVALLRVPLPGAPAGLLLELNGGEWLYATGFLPRYPERLAERVRTWLTRAELGPVRWTAEPALVHALQTTDPAGRDRATSTKRASSLATLPRDLKHLTLPRAFRPSRPADLALSVAARGVVRSFARRLPGFAASSLPYLFANVLDVAARVEEEEGRLIATLGRPPLQVVLGATGLAQATHHLRWLSERPLVLSQG